MAGHRPERVAHLVQVELARLLLEEAKNPRLREVIVTAVRMTPDLRLARVYFRTLGPASDAKGLTRALEGASHFLRGQVAHALGLRVTPELRFEYDATPDTARRLDDLLRAAGTAADDEDTEE